MTNPSNQGPHGGVVVVGMGRSGTSMLTKLLQASGLHLGPPEILHPPNDNNQRGFFEHEGIMGLNERILASMGRDFYRPPRLRPAALRKLSPFVGEAKKQVEALRALGPWGFKDPRTTTLLPFWMPLLPGARYVICFRQPQAVARSIEKIWPYTRNESLALWAHYTLEALRHTAGQPRILAAYEDLLSDPAGQSARLQAFCGLEASPSGAAAVVEPELAHQNAGFQELLDDPRLPSAHRNLYFGLLACSRAEISGPELGRLVSDFEEWERRTKWARFFPELRRASYQFAKRRYKAMRARLKGGRP
jgi:hypothetical protein